MYTKRQDSWLKHIDFCILDIICFELAYFLANVIRFSRAQGVFHITVYRDVAVVGIFVSIAVAIIFGTFKDVLKKDFLDDMLESLKQTAMVVFVLLLYLYFTQQAFFLSRIVYLLTFTLYFAFGLAGKVLWKRILKKMRQGKGSTLLIITRAENASDCLKNLQNRNYNMFRIVGFALMDRSIVGEEIEGVPVVANGNSTMDYIQSEWVDAVFIDDCIDGVMRDVFTKMIGEMGVVIHEKLTEEEESVGTKRFVERIGSYVVLTTSMNYASGIELFFKRVIDILGGLVGTIITGILYVIFWFVIRKESPGPVFFKQTRIGRNGKEFEIYKFRTMYPDAEERKQELMEQNRVDSDYMFKLEFDPRVIGNEILPDGTQKTGFMELARKYSLDEFPQFINVLKGDMSLVGTRPPTVEEYKLYKRHHHARLATRPGITGLWQVSGRSNITDFETVVALDTQYIKEWSLWLDLKILFKTVKVVLNKEGSM